MLCQDGVCQVRCSKIVYVVQQKVQCVGQRKVGAVEQLIRCSHSFSLEICQSEKCHSTLSSNSEHLRESKKPKTQRPIRTPNSGLAPLIFGLSIENELRQEKKVALRLTLTDSILLLCDSIIRRRRVSSRPLSKERHDLLLDGFFTEAQASLQTAFAKSLA